MPFCIALLEKYNVIIGRKWLEYFHVDLAVANRKLLWPRLLPSTFFFNKFIIVSRLSFTPPLENTNHQIDADRRDLAIDQELSNLPNAMLAPITLKPFRELWKPTSGRHNFKNEARRQFNNMQANLAGTF